MRPHEPLVRRAQVGVRVEVQDPEPGVARGARLDRAVRRRVIAADEHREPTVFQRVLGVFAHPLVELAADRVHALEVREPPRVVAELASGLDDRIGEAGCFLVPLRDPRVERVHVDPRSVRSSVLQVVEVDLAAGRENRLGPVRGPAPVRGRRVKRNAEHLDPRLVGAGRQAEDPAARERGRVGIELGHAGKIPRPRQAVQHRSWIPHPAPS